MVMSLNTLETTSDVTVIKMIPADWNPYQKLYDELLSPTVRISSEGGIGSGVVISATDSSAKPPVRTDWILTAAHVVGKESTVTVTFYSYTKAKQDILCELCAFVVMSDTTKDLALIKVDSGTHLLRSCGRLAPRNYSPFLFTPIYTVGCSLGLAPRPSEGIITVIAGDHWEVSSPILPGNSGGPVFDAKTHAVIGIAVWVKTYYGQLITTMAGIVPIQTIYEFMDEIRSTKPEILNKHQFPNDQNQGFNHLEFKHWNLFRDSDLDIRISSVDCCSLLDVFPRNACIWKRVSQSTDAGDVIKRANQSSVKQQPALRKDTTMLVSHVKLMATIPLETANRVIEKWARSLKEESPDMYAKILARIPDMQRFVERLAQPANAGYQGFVNPAFTSKSGQGSSDIEIAHGANLKRSYGKFMAKLNFLFGTVDGVAAKRFKELVDTMKSLFGTGMAERSLPFTGTKIEGRSCVPIAVHWLVKDKRVLDWLRAGDSVIEGGPFLVTVPNTVPSFKAALTQRLIQAGAVIVKSNYDSLVMSAQNDRTNHLIQSMIDPALGLTPFATVGLSHVNYIMDHDQLFLEVQIDQI
jgi:hypothetical protein